jgi:hypothetical protein
MDFEFVLRSDGDGSSPSLECDIKPVHVLKQLSHVRKHHSANAIIHVGGP